MTSVNAKACSTSDADGEKGSSSRFVMKNKKHISRIQRKIHNSVPPGFHTVFAKKINKSLILWCYFENIHKEFVHFFPFQNIEEKNMRLLYG